MSVDYEPLLPVHWTDPYETYRRLRDEAPVHWAPRSGLWCVSRYEDVAQVLCTPEDFSSVDAAEILLKRGLRLRLTDLLPVARFMMASRINPLSLLRGRSVSTALLNMDAPQHGVLRSIVNRGFTPRRIQGWDARIREIVVGCMSRLAGGGSFDVVHDLAIPLPITVIAEMLGIETEKRAQFKHWSDEIVAGSSSGLAGVSVGRLLQAMTGLHRYLRGVVQERRRKPADDLISVLVDERHGQSLDDREVAQFVSLLLIAGNETTTNLIGNATRTLLDHPETVAELNERPELVPAMIEEALRFESPIQFLIRRVARDVELAGTRLEEDSHVAVLLASANRDERQFEDPDRFDIHRREKGHLAFGFGPHFCLGASLARLEAKVALEALVPELAHLERQDPETELIQSLVVRGPSTLRLVPTRANAA
jgi:cytochrome P450